MFCYFILVLNIILANSLLQDAPFLPPPPRDLPPGFEAVLPANIVSALKSIHESNIMTPYEKHENIDKIMVSLPSEILDKLPPPPGFDRLPQDIKNKLKAIHRDKTLKWYERHEQIRRVIDNLPPDVRRFLPPPPSMEFEHLSLETKERLKAIHDNRNLGHVEKFYKIREVINDLPHEIRSKLPPSPPTSFFA